ncbi:aminotransferase-like domain-containing protein [Aminipila sp.]|uniref:aminotransferase-like domain-containing protein n=1 Tax=Aminipila sp. TaxID=2060095 RepID=UPI0028963819|nr:PLP-dependent aminotransferase family protein [Aminipila sp.]
MTKYYEIIQYLQTQITNNQIKPGNRLPPIRAIAQAFHCSTSTVVKAYGELERSHIIYPVSGSGYYLVENHLQPLDLSQEIIDFASVAPGSDILPYKEFQHCINQAISLYKEELFSYCDPQGMERPRKTMAKQLQDYQIFTDWQKIVITTGSQQAISILSSMSFPNGKTNILVEQPTYYGIIKSLELSGHSVLGIERKENGLDKDALERIFCNGNIKFFYTMPRFQNPTGFSYTNSDKKEIVALAEKYDVYIVEDDYLADLDNDHKADPLYAFSRTDKVIYIKSYSKTFLPGLRLATAILPQELLNPFVEYKKWTDLTSSALSQAALEIFITSGMYANHRKNLEKIFRDRMKCLRTVAAQNADCDITWRIPETGFFASFTTNSDFAADRLVPRLALDNVHLLNAEACFIPSYKRSNLFRVSLGKTDEPQIHLGISAIYRAIQELKTTKISKTSFMSF